MDMGCRLCAQSGGADVYRVAGLLRSMDLWAATVNAWNDALYHPLGPRRDLWGSQLLHQRLQLDAPRAFHQDQAALGLNGLKCFGGSLCIGVATGIP
jgi:hypothetical protein